MRRRDVLAVAGAALRPRLAAAQQRQRVGVLLAWPEKDRVTQATIATFSRAMARLGWEEGKNLEVDYRFAAGDPALFERYARELVGLSPDVILGSTETAVLALKRQTATTPIVFTLVLDPVADGLVQSLARPGGNLTGFTILYGPTMGKWVQLLKEAVPAVRRVAVLYSPAMSPNYGPILERELPAAARAVGVTIRPGLVNNLAQVGELIDELAREPGGGLVCLPDPFLVSHRDVIISAATRRRLPLISVDFFVRSGGLLAYWFDPVGIHGEAATYVDRILRGARPRDLPVQLEARFNLIVNLQAARALGLTIPPTFLARADEVIE